MGRYSTQLVALEHPQYNEAADADDHDGANDGGGDGKRPYDYRLCCR